MNKRKKMITLFVTGALAVVAVFGAVGYRAVYAQSPMATPSAPGNQAAPGNQSAPGNQAAPAQQGMGRQFFKGERGGGVTDADLASALGITTEQLQAAYTTANTEALKQAVSKGLITQAQADQITANGLNRRMMDWYGIFNTQNGIDYNALLAQALNITTDKLQAAYATAYNTSIDNAVTNGNLTQAQADLMKGEYALKNDTKFQSAMQSAYEAAVKQAVTDGVITQAQADAILAQQSQKGGFGFGFSPGFGGHGGRGHGGPGFFGAPDGSNNPQNTTPNTTGSGL